MHDRVFIDSNIWLYALIEQESPDRRHSLAAELVAGNADRKSVV